MNAPSPSAASGPIPVDTDTAGRETAADGRGPQAASATANPAPIEPTTLSAESEGRRTLSTAYVRVGPDGYISVQLRSGGAVVLRDVVVGAKTYCGVQSPGGAKFCGGFADVAAATPGSGPVRAEPDVTVAPSAPTKRE